MSAEPQERKSSKRTLPLWLPWMAAVVALVYAPALFVGEVFFRRDIARYVHPLFVQVQRRLQHGQLPLWSPAEFGGVPLLGDGSSATLYLPKLLLMWLPAASAITWLIFAHHLLAALGARALLLRWHAPAGAALAGGLAFALAGYLVAMDNSMVYLVGICWGPWVWYALDRLLARRSARNAALLAATFALVFTSGELQFTYLCVLLCGAYTLTCARPVTTGLLAVGVAGLAALGLVAVQLLPLLSVIGASSRIGGLELAQAQSWALHPARLLELFTAHPFGLLSEQSFWGQAFVNSAQHTTPWSNGLYLGAVLPWLSLLAPRDRRTYFLWGLAAVAVLLALGPHAPLDGALRTGLPLWASFRYPEKLMSLATLALCLAGARGLGVLLDSGGAERAGRDALALLGALAGGAFLVAGTLEFAPALWRPGVESLLAAGRTGHVGAERALQLLESSVWRSVALLCCAAMVVALGRRGALSNGRHGWALVILVVVDVASANARLVELARSDFYDVPSPLAQALVAQADPTRPQRVYRVPLGFAMPPGHPLASDAAAVNEVYHQWMRMTLAPKVGVEYPHVRYATGYSASIGQSFERFWSATTSRSDGRALDLMAVGFVIDAVQRPRHRDRPGDRVVATLPGLDARLVALGDPAPLARIVHEVSQVDSAGSALARLASPDFAPRRQAVVEGTVTTTALAAGAQGDSVRVVREAPERLELEARLERAGLLVVANTYDTGWRARVDGAPAPLLRANRIQQGVALRAGTHRVVLSYHDRTLLPGALVTLLSVLLLVGAAIRFP